MPLDTHDLRMIQLSMADHIRTVLKASAVDDFARQREISLGELCRLAGINRSALTRLRNGTRSPATATLSKLADVLQCSIDDLIEVEQLPTSSEDSGDEAVARAAALVRYGFKCACCGEDEYQFLTVTPIVPTDEPRLTMLRRLRVQGYPAEGYMTYCLNCDAAKGSRNACPHATPLQFVSNQARAYWSVKVRVLRAYGGQCFCCGLTNPRMLAVDSGGQRAALQLMAGHGGMAMYRRIADAGCPPNTRFRVACFNCGRFETCPHAASR